MKLILLAAVVAVVSCQQNSQQRVRPPANYRFTSKNVPSLDELHAQYERPQEKRAAPHHSDDNEHNQQHGHGGLGVGGFGGYGGGFGGYGGFPGYGFLPPQYPFAATYGYSPFNLGYGGFPFRGGYGGYGGLGGGFGGGYGGFGGGYGGFPFAGGAGLGAIPVNQQQHAGHAASAEKTESKH